MKPDIEKKTKSERYENADINSKLVMNFLDINHTMHALYEGRGSQKRILILLLQNESITQHELTEKLGIKPGSASEVIAKLEAQGLINKTPSSQDRRTANIALTDKGRTLAKEAKADRDDRHKEMFSSLSENEKLALIAQLEKINTDWEKFGCAEHRHHHHEHHHHNHHGEQHEKNGGKKGCDENCSTCPHPCGRKKHNA